MRFLFSIIFSSVVLISSGQYRKEAHRPLLHFSPKSGWMNDPNGMVFYKGRYHLFYQYYPDSTVWGPMHWAHAVSKDMIHWKHLPIALYPDSLGYIFSGSAVADSQNSSRFKTGKEDPLVALFTYFDPAAEKAGGISQTQGMAFSNNNGKEWTKYNANPIIKNSSKKDFRDPKVFWHEATKHWVMCLAVGDHIEFYHSPDLKNWGKTGEFGMGAGSHGGVWECPDLFPLQAEGSNETKWVLIVSIGNGGPNGGSATQYFVGDFDGTNFTNSHSAETVRWIDYGTDNYAGVTWSNTTERVFLGWMSNWQYAQLVPTQKWRSAMTLPRQLLLMRSGDEYFVKSKPIAGLEKLRKKHGPVLLSEVAASIKPLNEIIIEADLEKTTASKFGIELSNSKEQKLLFGYNTSTGKYFVDRVNAGKSSFSNVFAARHNAPRLIRSKKVRLHIFTDRSSIEVFADDGLTCITTIFFPSEDFNAIRLFKENGQVEWIKNECYTLKAVWR